MKTRFYLAMTAAAMAFALPGAMRAQAPAGAPAGTTGQCKDGTYSQAATKSGACRGHNGVQTWYTASAGAAAKTATPAPAAAPTAAPAAPVAPATPAKTPKPSGATTTTAKTAKTPAPGGGPGLVWLNTGSNVYHCSGTEDYGTTKQGKYMSEAAAKAAGGHADHGKACQ